MRRSLVLLLTTLPVLAACGGKTSDQDTAGSDAAANTQVKAQLSTEELIARGEQVYQTVCIACHTMEAPPTAAPPMTHVARHYRQAFTDGDSAIAHIVSFLQSPSEERSKMPKRAIERFGLMAPQLLPEDQLRAVATYVWSLPDPQPH